MSLHRSLLLNTHALQYLLPVMSSRASIDKALENRHRKKTSVKLRKKGKTLLHFARVKLSVHFIVVVALRAFAMRRRLLMSVVLLVGCLNEMTG